MKMPFERDVTYAVLIVIYLLLFSWQLNWYPGERFPEWDNHWGDVRNFGRIITVGRALSNLEAPAIDPYMGFGFNRASDLFGPWNPMYLLIYLFPARSVLWLNQFVFMAIAAVGSYFFLKRFIGDRFISFVGGASRT